MKITYMHVTTQYKCGCLFNLIHSSIVAGTIVYENENIFCNYCGELMHNNFILTSYFKKVLHFFIH
jgi:hypothetical protein